MKLTPWSDRVLPLCLAALGALLAAATLVRAQPPDDRLERILAAWRDRQHALKSVCYTVRGEGVRPKGSGTDPQTGRPLPKPEPPEDIIEPKEYKLLLDFADKRFRMELTEQTYAFGAGQLEPRASTTVFDRKDLFTLRPRSGNSNAAVPWEGFDVIIGRNRDAGGSPLNGTITASLGPLLFAHGLVPRLTRPPDFDLPLEGKDFFVHGQGVQEGRPCVVVRTFPHETFRETTFDEYWVDLERDGAIARHTIYRNEKALVDREVAWQLTPHGWMPLHWTETAWDPHQRIRYVSRLEVVDFEADPAVSGADFQVVIEPGMNVMEITIGKAGDVRKYFRVREDGGWNEVVNGVERPVRSWTPYYWGGGLAAVVVGIVLWRLRRGTRRQVQPPASAAHGFQMP